MTAGRQAHGPGRPGQPRPLPVLWVLRVVLWVLRACRRLVRTAGTALWHGLVRLGVAYAGPACYAAHLTDPDTPPNHESTADGLPTGHPERVATWLPPDETERALWAQFDRVR